MADEEVKIIAGDLMVSYNMCGTKNKFYNKIIVILFVTDILWQMNADFKGTHYGAFTV